MAEKDINYIIIGLFVIVLLFILGGIGCSYNGFSILRSTNLESMWVFSGILISAFAILTVSLGLYWFIKNLEIEDDLLKKWKILSNKEKPSK